MKYKVVQCLTYQPISDKDKWIYTWKQFAGIACYRTSEYEFHVNKHRIPFFLSLHAHLIIEHLTETLWNLVFKQFPCKRLLLVYDLIHGFVCGYNMREILHFWRKRE